ncbi:MAG: SulP family inorganic anion transporter [Eubacteriales bacterium]|nr:SulP family inorganic anion transporter [Eubacteriales bacterium]
MNFKIRKENVSNDIIAGIVVALVSIPIAMGYSQIAGLPVIYGLFGSILPVLVYGLMTSSPQFVFGVDATPAALVGGALATLGITAGSSEAMMLVPVITLVVSVWLFVFYMLKAGRLVNYISTPVMGGFISGIGVTIILMQISKLFGGNAGTGELFVLLPHIWTQLGSFHAFSAVLGFGTVIIILLAKKYMPKFPMSVALMVAGAIATAVFKLDNYGVKLLPNVERQMPRFLIPRVDLFAEHAQQIMLLGLTIALVIVAQTLLAANNYALKYDYKIKNNREILSYAAGNLMAALIGCCPVNGSVSRTGIADQYGCKTQLMSIACVVTMLLVLLVGTPFLKYLPVPVLTGIVIAALIGILEIKLAKKLWRTNRTEFLIFMAAFFGVLIFGTLYGVIIGIILSFIAVIIRAVVPPKSFIGVIPGHEGFYNLNRNRNARPIKGAIMYRFSGNLFFANINKFQEDIENAVTPDTKLVIIDASGIGSIDITAADRLVIMNKSLRKKGIRFYITEHVGNLNDQLRTLGAGTLIEEGAVRRTISLALRDARVERPYPIEGMEPSLLNENVEDNERLAEFEWAFGEDAEEMMDRLAYEIAENIANTDIRQEEAIKRAEKQVSWGRVGLFDEDEILDRLEMHIQEIAAKAGFDAKELEDKIEQRRVIVEYKLMKINPEALGMLKAHRKQMETHFRKTNPKAYEHMLQIRKEHILQLENDNPQLAAKMKTLYQWNEKEQNCYQNIEE